MKKPALKSFDPVQALLVAHATNDRINRYLIQNLPAAAWRAEPPGGKGRTVAAMFAHIHNVRLMWLKSAGWSGTMPAKLEAESFSPSDAVGALKSSGEALQKLLTSALAGDGRVKGFKPDACSFMAYLFAHDAHHRGQASMLAQAPCTGSGNGGPANFVHHTSAQRQIQFSANRLWNRGSEIQSLRRV